MPRRAVHHGAALSEQMMLAMVAIARARRARDEEELPAQARRPQPSGETAAARSSAVKKAMTLRSVPQTPDNSFTVDPRSFVLSVEDDSGGRSPVSNAPQPPPPAMPGAPAAAPAGSQQGGAAPRDDPREVPMEWALPGGVREWQGMLPWVAVAGLLQMWDSAVPSELAPPPDILFSLHGLLGACAGCYGAGQTKPAIMARGTRMYYSDSSAQCSSCMNSKLDRGDRVVSKVWHEISPSELDAYGRHTFAVVLSEAAPAVTAAVLRAAPVREVRLTSGRLLRALSALPHIAVLHLPGCLLRDEDLLQIRPIAHQLRELNVSCNAIRSLAPIADVLVQLRSLNFSRNFPPKGSNDSQYEWLRTTLPAIGKLRRLVTLGNVNASMVDILANVRCLRELIISASPASSPPKLAKLGQHLRLELLVTCSLCRWTPAHFIYVPTVARPEIPGLPNMPSVPSERLLPASRLPMLHVIDGHNFNSQTLADIHQNVRFAHA